MRTIGITGGVGTGKTELLAYIREKYNCAVILADVVAHELQEPGGSCYEEVRRLLGREALKEDGAIDRARMAERIFADRTLLEKVNAVVHPAVKEYLLARIAQEREKQVLDFLFIEAALLIENGYGELLDELWYIYTDEESRRERLKRSRGYPEEKIRRIMEGQLSDEEYRAGCKVVIDNSGKLEDTYSQIDEKLGEYLWRK